MNHPITEKDLLGQKIVNACFQVHQQLGPGLLESVYEECLTAELLALHIPVSRQQPLPVYYKNKKLEIGYRIDLLAGDLIIIEIKAIDALQPIHYAQVLTYLKLSQKKLGYLVNFNVSRIKTGIHRIIL